MARSCQVSNEEMEGLFDEAPPDRTLLFPDDNSYLFQDDAVSWDNDIPDFDLDALLAIPETDGYFTADDLSWSLNPTTTHPSVYLDSSDPSLDSDLIEFTPELSIDIPTRLKVDSTSPSDLQEACCVTNHRLAQVKRKWNESVVVFSSDPNVEISTRKRSAFDERRRKEVAIHRRVGACVQCKLRRGSVSSSHLVQSKRRNLL
jgi:hypothetical protein